MIPQRESYTNAQNNFILGSLELETIQISIKIWMDKQNVLHAANEILLSNQQYYVIYKCNTMDDSQNDVKERSQIWNTVYAWGLPGGSVIKNPPLNAGNMDSIPDLGRFPHAAEQRSQYVATTEPRSHNHWAHNSRACAPQREKPSQWEALTPQQRVAPACCN